MSKGPYFRPAILCFAAVGALIASPQEPSKQRLDQQYQAAVADYESGRFSAAADKLEKILPYAPKSYEIHELIGMVYASEASDQTHTQKALDHLKTAVQLKPDLAEARTNLGTCLLHSGKSAAAGEQFRKALELDPKTYDTNHNLGEFLIQTGKLNEALPLLEQAQSIKPSYDNGYDLAMADFLSGKLDAARSVVQSLIDRNNTGELHNLLAQVEEKQGKFVEAANDYEAAAHLDPSEENLFDWASEMLLHRAYDPAIAIFQKAAERYPKSARIQIGLGLTFYSRGKYEDAIKALVAGADLTPSDPRCYHFLSKAYNSSPLQAEDVIQRFRRYAELQPANAMAQYYYALSLWKGKRVEDAGVDVRTIESLLQKSIALNDSIAEAHLQLGNLYADQHQYEKSIPQYARALQLDSNLADAHFRLGTDYVHTGQKEKAQKEFAVYQKQRAEHLAELEKERDEVQQFVLSEKAAETAKP